MARLEIQRVWRHRLASRNSTASTCGGSTISRLWRASTVTSEGNMAKLNKTETIAARQILYRFAAAVELMQHEHGALEPIVAPLITTTKRMLEHLRKETGEDERRNTDSASGGVSPREAYKAQGQS